MNLVDASPLRQHVGECIERTLDHRPAGIGAGLQHDFVNFRRAYAGIQGLLGEANGFLRLADNDAFADEHQQPDARVEHPARRQAALELRPQAVVMRIQVGGPTHSAVLLSRWPVPGAPDSGGPSRGPDASPDAGRMRRVDQVWHHAQPPVVWIVEMRQQPIH